MDDRAQQRTGVLYGLAAFGWWGFVAGYFKAVGHVPALEVLAHRVVWSLALLGGLILARGRGSALRALFRDRTALLLLCCTTLLIACNWLVFIWAVTHDRLLEASLGYFINPLMNILLGFVFLRERLRRLQTAAVLLATAAVLWLALGVGTLPWVSLVLAGTFGLYGLLRKIVRADGTLGLAAETLLLLPLALGWLVWRESGTGTAFLHEGVGTALLLAASGVVSALPLIWFAEAARRLRYATVGFLQYLAPTLQFLLAVVAFGEAFTHDHAVSFGLIWCALALYSWDTLRHQR
jgi:chloramphenicol-sensitive protein RarD